MALRPAAALVVRELLRLGSGLAREVAMKSLIALNLSKVSWGKIWADILAAVMIA